jgi:hypothetical protein
MSPAGLVPAVIRQQASHRKDGRAEEVGFMRKALAAVGIATVIVLSAGPAFADRGAPGTTYPENNNTSGCIHVLSTPSVSGFHQSGTALNITLGLISDACLGG